MPSQVLPFKTQLQKLQQYLSTSHIQSNLSVKVFGCTGFIHARSKTRSKLVPKATKCVFLGYFPTQKGYKCYDLSHKKICQSWCYFHWTQSLLQKVLSSWENLIKEDRTFDYLNEYLDFDHSLNKSNTSNRLDKELELTTLFSNILPYIENNLNLGGEIKNKKTKRQLVIHECQNKKKQVELHTWSTKRVESGDKS